MPYSSILHAELSLNGAEQDRATTLVLAEIFMARTGNGSVCILVANHATQPICLRSFYSGLRSANGGR